MNDFVSMEEVLAFFVMGPMPAEVSPLDHIDQYAHGVAISDSGVDPADYAALVERFGETFRPGVKAPAGGDVLFRVNSE